MNRSSSTMTTMTKKTSIGFMSWFLLHSLSLTTEVHARATAARSYRLLGLESVVPKVTEGKQQESVLGFDEIPPSSELCVSEGGRVSASWTSEPGEGASIADWVTAGEYCCSGACQSYKISIAGAWNETGSARCECGPELSPSSSAKKEDESGSSSITCVSDGGVVSFGHYLRSQEMSALWNKFRTNFCCSGQCVDGSAKSSVSRHPVENEDGEFAILFYEQWASGSSSCVCGVPPSYASPPTATSSEAFVEGEEVAELKGETLAPPTVVAEIADLP